MHEELVSDLRKGYTDRLKEAADAIEELTGFVQEAERDRDEYRERLDKANDAIEELSKCANEWEILAESWRKGCKGLESRMPRWIPVTEQCPEKSGDYLVFDDCRNLYVNEWHCLLKKWQYDDSRITHWQPLPEPPKEET